MKSDTFDKHQKLTKFPPAKLAYILYRRMVEQGLRPTSLWLRDKVARRTRGFSPPEISQILPGLYVGGQHNRKGMEAMAEAGITAVVNMREERDDAATGVAPEAYLWLPTTDDAAPSVEDLARGAAFIKEHIDAGRGVYIHCASGVGRAPTMAAAYLVSKGMSAEEAWQTIRRGRPFIRPTPPQVKVIAALAERSAEAPPQQAAAMDERVQRALERITGDAGITDALIDAEAKVLIAWAEAEVTRLVAETMGMEEDEAWAFLDERLDHLRRYLRKTAKASAASDDPAAALRATLKTPVYPAFQEANDGKAEKL